MTILPKDPNGCPYLLLSPMQGVGDRSFRKAISCIGGFDEAIKDFIRVPHNGHVKSLARVYNPNEISPFLLTPQIMGSDLNLMPAMAKELERKGARRIDLNCGCPSNIVTGRRAGSFLLKDPEVLYQVAKSLTSSISIPVTVKMRSGYDDVSLFRENLLAAQESGIQYLTLHPRTKIDGYESSAKWELIAEAKSILRIPVVGNGDIFSPDDALRMLKMTRCDALMIGRGILINPFLFHQIRACFSKKNYSIKWDDLVNYLNFFHSQMPLTMPKKTRINKLKQLLSYVFQGKKSLLIHRKKILTSTPSSSEDLLNSALLDLKESYSQTDAQ